MFPFTFKLPAPGLSNPFLQTSTSSSTLKSEPVGKIPIRRPRPPKSRSVSPAPPINRKRGWEPSFSEASLSATTLASSNGYLDTPAKYRDMANLTPDELHEIETMAEELPPPAKRRRGLAGSIVSTAVSAALIGTAVGLTFYRMWRDRGKEQEQLPPPPYHPGEWTPQIVTPPVPEVPRAINVLPPTPRRKTRAHQVGSLSKRPATARRTVTRTRTPVYTPPPPPSQPSSSSFYHPSSSHDEIADDSVVDQMDWIGDKLAALIEEGKKALGKEVVVMSETPEDEVDDGSDAWEEEDNLRTSSPRRTRRTHMPPPSYSPSASPRAPRFDVGSPPISIGHSRDPSNESTPGGSLRFSENPDSWGSPLLRESMEQARAKMLRDRGL